MLSTEECQKVLGAILVAFPSYKPSNMQMALDIYKSMFNDYSYKEVMQGLQTYIVTDTSGFAPSIGQIIDKIHKINEPEEMSPNMAWSLVYKALCNSTYYAEKEFEKLPELVQKTVGSPAALESLAKNEGFNEEVEKSLFIRQYNTELQRAKENAKLPQAIKDRLAMSNNNLIGDKNE